MTYRTQFRTAVFFILSTVALTAALRADDQVSVSSETVKQTQKELKQKGLYDAEIDGILGPRTREGLRRYQKENGLSGDGRLTRETAHRLGVVKSEDQTPGEHFEDAGAEIKEHYGQGGKDLGKGTKEAGKDIKEGEIVEGGKDVGKGVGKFGKEVGKGTAKAAKKVGKGVKDAVDGEDSKKDPKEKE